MNCWQRESRFSYSHLWSVGLERFKQIIRKSSPPVRGSASYLRGGSGLQVPFLEFLRRRAELAELVNCRACWREGERLKRFLEHFVEVLPGGDAGGDVRIVMLAGSLRNERRNVIDQRRLDDRIVGCGEERGRGSGWHREGGHSVNHLLFQFEQLGVGFATMPERPRSLSGR